MQLKLPENIKRYRKSMGITQEELAEALGVTVGAVSKWENGNNAPDILTLMEIADFFNISIDELLSYDMSSKKIEDICDRIGTLCAERRYDEAVSDANTALVRYPHTFKVIYTCATLYYLKGYEQRNDKDKEKAIELFNRAMNYISQNEDPDVSEYIIKRRIAEMYSRSDPDKALDLLKGINYDGCNSVSIATIYMDKGDREEALKYYNTAFLNSFSEQYSVFSNASMTVASSGKRKDYQTAIELMDAELKILELYAKPGGLNYMHKLKTILLILKAWWLSCIKQYKEMEECVKEAYEIAVRLDEQGVPYELSSSLKFYFSEAKSYFYDSIGIGAVDGIETMFTTDENETIKKNYKYMQNVIDCWYKLKEQDKKQAK